MLCCRAHPKPDACANADAISGTDPDTCSRSGANAYTNPNARPFSFACSVRNIQRSNFHQRTDNKPVQLWHGVDCHNQQHGFMVVDLHPQSNGVNAACFALPPSTTSTGNFLIFGGLIVDPYGQQFIARGIDVMEGNEPSASTIIADFPGINFVRYAIYDYANPSQLSAWITSLTSLGIVVEPEDHNNNAGGAGGGQGVIFSGSTLTNELAWYSSMGQYFASNPYVWFGTNNEPSETDSSGNNDPAALSDWQLQTYQAVRGAGNNNIIMIESNCYPNGSAPAMACNVGYTASDYSGMTNVIWDDHFYGWVDNYSTDQTITDQTLANEIASSQQITSADGVMPVLIGEYGNSTTGQSIDPNGNQVITAVETNGVGSAAWAWGTGNPGDGLTTGNNGLSDYGQMVSAFTSQQQTGAPNPNSTPGQ